MTANERKVYCYLVERAQGELIQSIRRYSADIRIPRSEVKKALQGLADKGIAELRTIKMSGGERLGVTIKEEL